MNPTLQVHSVLQKAGKGALTTEEISAIMENIEYRKQHSMDVSFLKAVLAFDRSNKAIKSFKY